MAILVSHSTLRAWPTATWPLTEISSPLFSAAPKPPLSVSINRRCLCSCDRPGLLRYPKLPGALPHRPAAPRMAADRKSTRLNSSHQITSYAVFCLKKKNVQLKVNFHSLLIDGGFAEGPDGTLAFHAAAPPSDEEVAQRRALLNHRFRHIISSRC